MFKYSLKELWHYKQFSLLYILASFLGSLGITLVLFYGNEITGQIKSKSKNILSADFAISSRRMISNDEISKYEAEFSQAVAQKSQSYEFFGMLARDPSQVVKLPVNSSVSGLDDVSGDKGNSEVNSQGDIEVSSRLSRLVLVKVIDDLYPFYGNLENEKGEGLSGNSLRANEILVYPEVLAQMELKVGDQVHLGEAVFTIRSSIERDQTQTFRLAQLAPRVFIHIKSLQATGLLKPGSTFTQAFLYKFKESADGAAISKKMKDLFRDPSVDFTYYEEASESSARQFKLFSDFLSLAALISFLIGLFGQFFINQSFLQRRIPSFCYLRFQGALRSQVEFVLISELVILSVLSALLTSALCYSMMPFLNNYLAGLFNLTTATQSFWPLVLMASAVSAVNSVMSFLPFRNTLLTMSPRALISGGFEVFSQLRLRFYLLLLLMGLFGLSIVISRSFRFAGLFVGLILIVFLLVQMVVWSFKKLKFEEIFQNWKSKYIFKSIRERSFAYQILMVSMLVSIVFISLLPQIRIAIENEIRPDQNNKPSLFLFDIQEDQWPQLLDYFAKEKISVLSDSNMVRARIITVNGINYERMDEEKTLTREEESEARSRNRGVNMTIKGVLNPTEKIVEGDFFKADGPEVSLEVRYAERMKIKLGDLIKFDIQGVETEARVTSLRKVNWNSFLPNFFIVFKPGFIDEAPKTYLAALPAGINKAQVQSELFKHYPNVSALDLDRFIKEGLSLIDQISVSFMWMSYLSLALGFLVFISIILVNIDERKRELSLLRLIGATQKEVRALLGFESMGLVFFCALLGSVFSLGISWILMKYFFESDVKIHGLFYLGLFAVVNSLSFVFVYLFSRQLSQRNPLEILRD